MRGGGWPRAAMTLLLFLARTVRSGTAAGSPSAFVPAATRCVFGTCRNPESYWRAARPFASKPALERAALKGPSQGSVAPLSAAIITSEPSASVEARHGEAVVRVLEDIKKPARDDRSYRMLWLKNGMQVLLASDPSTDMAAASMNIHVGHFQDPEEFPGLAHFHEHMVFLGTERYPVEGSYEAFLNEHGGSSNAYTAMEDTNYYFSVKWDHLHGALDRFSAFFISPRFDNSSVDREVKAVDSEFYNNLNNDGWRLFQLQKSLADPKHPFHKFGSGNAQTLPATSASGVDIRDALLQFHTTLYSANIMKLAVIGRESLDELQKWVVPLFSTVRNTQQPPHFMPPVPAFPPSTMATVLKVVPVKEMRRLSLGFPLPIDWQEQAKMRVSKPSRYLSYVVGHEGAGSLYALFHANGWIESLSAGASTKMADMEIFKVSMSLTEEGAKHVDEIITHVFQYLKLVRESPVSRELWEEMATMSEIKFLFREKENAVDFASGASNLMVDYPPENLLYGPYAMSLDEAAIQDYAKQLLPDNLQVTLVDSAYEAQAAAQPDQWAKEKWYGTPHRLEPLDEKTKALWSNPPPLPPTLHLPPPNAFLPTDFSLRCDDSPDSTAVVTRAEEEDIWGAHPTPPTLIKDTPGLRIYHKLDRQFRVPKATFFAHLVTPQVYASPLCVIHHRLYSLLLGDELKDFSYDASVAGLAYSVTSRTTGLVLKVSGYSHKLPVLLDRVVKRTRSLLDEIAAKHDDPELLRKFEQQRVSLLREYTNFDLDSPYELAMYYVRQVLDGQCWHLHQYIHLLNSPVHCNPARMAATVREGLSRLDVDVLAYGNLEESEAAELTSTMLRGVFPSAAAPASPPATSQHGWTAPTLASAPASLESWTPTGAVKSQGEDYALSPLYDGEAPQERTVMLPKRAHVVYQMKGPNGEEENSAIEMHLQVGSVVGEDVRGSVLLDLLSHCASTSAYQRLRTEEQLGYVVFSFTRRMNGVQGFSVVVQGVKADPLELDRRIEEWMLGFRQEMQNMSDEELQKHISAVVSQKLEKDKRMSEEAYRHWSEIAERRMDFYREVREVEALKGVSKADLLSFFDAHLAADAPERRKLSVYVFGSKHADRMLPPDSDVTAGETAEGARVLLGDMEAIRAFKRTLPMFPAVTPIHMGPHMEEARR